MSVPFADIAYTFVYDMIQLVTYDPIYSFVGVWLVAYILSLIINLIKRRT